MTLGDIIEKILGLFGVAPGPQRRLVKRISAVRDKIAEMEDSRNTIMRANTMFGKEIDELKRKLAVETNVSNQKMIMDQVDELERELDRKQVLAQQMADNITAQRAIRAKCEQLLEQLRHGADPAEIEILMERVEDMVELHGEAVDKVDKLDGMGRKARVGKAAEKADEAHAARMAAMLGRSPAAPASAKKEPAAAAPATPSDAPSPAPKQDDSATSAQKGTVAVG